MHFSQSFVLLAASFLSCQALAAPADGDNAAATVAKRGDQISPYLACIREKHPDAKDGDIPPEDILDCTNRVNKKRKRDLDGEPEGDAALSKRWNVPTSLGDLKQLVFNTQDIGCETEDTVYKPPGSELFVHDQYPNVVTAFQHAQEFCDSLNDKIDLQKLKQSGFGYVFEKAFDDGNDKRGQLFYHAGYTATFTVASMALRRYPYIKLTEEGIKGFSGLLIEGCKAAYGKAMSKEGCSADIEAWGWGKMRKTKRTTMTGSVGSTIKMFFDDGDIKADDQVLLFTIDYTNDS